jgi:hypothetical protein
VYVALLDACKSGQTAIPCAQFQTKLALIKKPSSAAHRQMCKEFNVSTMAWATCANEFINFNTALAGTQRQGGFVRSGWNKGDEQEQEQISRYCSL